MIRTVLYRIWPPYRGRVNRSDALLDAIRDRLAERRREREALIELARHRAEIARSWANEFERRNLNQVVEGFLAVTEWESADGTRYVTVYQSPRVHDDDDWLADVRDLLTRTENEVVRDEWVRDEQMIGLRARSRTYRIK